MSTHIGISCDSCLKRNFSGRRYKCLLCENYDLCDSCYEKNCQSENHLQTHPMQCVLTKTLYDLFYSGETISYQTVVSLTCPYCGQSGFVLQTLTIHCLEKHSILTSNLITCPICVGNSSQDRPTRFVSLVDHVTKEHHEENSIIINQIQRSENRKENFDQNYDESLPLFILAERLFSKDENRRQRLTQTLVRNHYNSTRKNSRGNIRNENFSLKNEFLFDFDHSLRQTPFFLTSIPPTDLPSIDVKMTNERINQKRSILSNNKQKRLNPIQQTILLNETSNFDNEIYQQNPISSLNYFNSSTSINITNENQTKLNKSPLSDTRSLLGKILKSTDNTKIHSEQDHLAFLHSLFLSSMSIK